MEKRQVEFLNAVENETAYGYIANNYTEFTKDELKDIIQELLFTCRFDSEDIIEELKYRWTY